jgi:dihydrolipoamide dehydrogenase
MKKNKITVIDGTARLKGEGAVAVTGRTAEALPDIAAKHIISPPARGPHPAGLEPDGELIWTYKEAMVPKAMPKSLLSSARAPSASSSPASIAPSAPR